MPMWHCPHCGTPQTESARCWVCRRSSTTCSTCRHFRRSVAAQVGYCGLDRRRLPLTGAEMRGCWEVGDIRPGDPVSAPPRQEAARSTHREFVPVAGEPRREGGRAAADRSPLPELAVAGASVPVVAEVATRARPDADVAIVALDGPESWGDRFSLFGDEV